MIELRTYRDAADRTAVIALWEEVFGYAADHNSPPLVIDQKLRADDGLFFVCIAEGALVGTIMCGYDGHRGWLYSLAVHPSARTQGHGARLVRHAEEALAGRGCLKVNLQILEANAAVAAFYQRLGYSLEPRVSMGRRLGERKCGGT
ncbi:MAG: acetyltransferase [Ramlibacter sp.]|jgi:ribosomal protein S18 acetylase RimI-like enzyme|nr:acetyltransferase [Ramlibacter sp.]